MMNRIDSIITTVENGLFAVLGEGPRTARRKVKAPSRKVARKAVRKTVKKKVRKRRK
jgi:hypothetical protein